jgi:hypothetical protein
MPLVLMCDPLRAPILAFGPCQHQFVLFQCTENGYHKPLGSMEPGVQGLIAVCWQVPCGASTYTAVPVAGRNTLQTLIPPYSRLCTLSAHSRLLE